MRAILNIDMKGLTLAQVREAMTTCGIAYGKHSVHWVPMPLPEWEEQSWETLAIHVDLPSCGEVDQLARMLGQNCIAVYSLDHLQGDLLGPDTSKYQPFNAELFRVV